MSKLNQALTIPHLALNSYLFKKYCFCPIVQMILTLHCIITNTLYCIALYIALHCIVLHYIVDYIANCIALYFTFLYYILHYILLYCIALHCTLYFIILHYVTKAMLQKQCYKFVFRIYRDTLRFKINKGGRLFFS